MDGFVQACAVHKTAVRADGEAQEKGQSRFRHGLRHAEGFGQRGHEGRVEKVRSGFGKKAGLPAVKAQGFFGGKAAFPGIGVAPAAHEAACEHGHAPPVGLVPDVPEHVHVFDEDGAVSVPVRKARLCGAYSVAAPCGRGGEKGQSVRFGHAEILPPQGAEGRFCRIVADESGHVRRSVHGDMKLMLQSFAERAFHEHF